MSAERWGVRHPGIGILYYDSEQEAWIAAGTAADFLGPSPAPVSPVEEALEAGTTVEGVLQLIVEEYYEGCKRYAAAPQPDSPERVFWRIRLGALSKYGSLLAAALGQAEPDWEAMREIAEQAVISDG